MTPYGSIAVGPLGRRLLPIEKLLIHAFPVDEMIFPSTVTERDIESLGGNTMHLKCVGLAMMMASALIDWDLPQSKLGKKFVGSITTSAKSTRPTGSRQASSSQNLRKRKAAPASSSSLSSSIGTEAKPPVQKRRRVLRKPAKAIRTVRAVPSASAKFKSQARGSRRRGA